MLSEDKVILEKRRLEEEERQRQLRQAEEERAEEERLAEEIKREEKRLADLREAEELFKKIETIQTQEAAKETKPLPEPTIEPEPILMNRLE